MKPSVPSLTGLALLALLMMSALAAIPAHGQQVPPIQKVKNELPTEPVWASVNAAAQGNYPGGNEVFDVFVVDSAVPPEGNVTIENETLSTTAWTGTASNPNLNTAIGLPVTLMPGQSVLNTITLPIPSDFSQTNFTADLKADVVVLNGTTPVPLVLTGSIPVYMLGLPLSQARTVTLTSTSVTTVASSGTVSSTEFGVGVAIPAIVAIILLALLVRGRNRT